MYPGIALAISAMDWSRRWNSSSNGFAAKMKVDEYMLVVRCRLGSRRRPCSPETDDLFGLVADQLQQITATAQRQQPGFGVDAQLLARVHDVQVAHGELADAVGGRERRVFHLFHAQAFGFVGEIGRLGVEQRVVV